MTRSLGTSTSNGNGIGVNVSGSSSSNERDAAVSDGALVSGLRNREEWALKALIEACGPYVYGAALRILRNGELAQEVAQDALLVMWWKPERFDPARGALRSFLMGVARLKAIDVVRSEEARRSRESLLAESARLLESPPADTGVAERIDIRAALSSLSTLQRQALFLAYFQGLTYRQVSTVLEVPEGTVKTRIREGLISLRTALAEFPAA